MKTKLLTAMVLIAISSSAIGLVFTHHVHDQGYVGDLEIRNDHSGRTNSAGCHNETKTGGYHCH